MPRNRNWQARVEGWDKEMDKLDDLLEKEQWSEVNDQCRKMADMLDTAPQMRGTAVVSWLRGFQATVVKDPSRKLNDIMEAIYDVADNRLVWLQP